MSTANGRNQARGGNGDFRRELEVADRDAEAARMYCRGATYQVIADTLGYASKGNAQRAVNQVFAERANTQELRLARETRLAELDQVRADAWAIVLDPPPLTDRVGRIVHDDGGRVVPDRQAWAAAAGVVLRTIEITAKLQGLNAPKRTHATIEGVLASISPGDLKAYITQRSAELGVDRSPEGRRQMLEQALAELDAEEAERTAIPAVAEPA